MRTIDADAFMDDIYNSIDEMTKIGIMVDGEWLLRVKLKDALDNAPTIEPTTHWIPCNERLPDENGLYLIQFEDKFFMVVDFYNGLWNASKYGQEYSFASNDVVAWMPLPEPYRESEDKK